MTGNSARQRRIAHFFDVLDVDRSGLIQLKDFLRLVERYERIVRFGAKAPDDDSFKAFALGWWEMLRPSSAPADGGSIGLAEFTDLFLKMASSEERVTSAGRELFDVLDQNGSDFISVVEYRLFLEVFGVDVSNREKHFSGFDTDRDGLVSKEEFGVLLHDFFISENPSDPGCYLFGDI